MVKTPSPHHPVNRGGIACCRLSRYMLDALQERKGSITIKTTALDPVPSSGVE